MPSKQFSLPFVKKEIVANNTFSFYFDRSQTSLDFLPGQYIRIILPQTTDIHTSRFFTIASSPLDEKHLVIVLKNGESEFKKSLFSIKPGESIKFFGPNGGLFFDEQDTSERVFLAGGLGLVSFYSMITYIAKKNISVPVTLIVSFSKKEDIFYYDELLGISKNHPHIKIVFSVTREIWNGETGRISRTLIKKYIKNILKPTYYIVGFPEMVGDTEELLENMGVPLSNIKTEAFVGY